MAKVITLARRSGNIGAGRPHYNAVKESKKDGFFYINEFANWLTGFKNDEIAHSSAQAAIFHKPTINTKRKYF